MEASEPCLELRPVHLTTGHRYPLLPMERPTPERRDLAAMVVPLGRALMAAEVPILDAHGLTMWGYVALGGLRDEPRRVQGALADAIGADKTRLIPVLDDLQERGLIRRVRDPDDRRAYLLSLTPAGRRLHDKAQRAIQRNEQRLLDRLERADQDAFLLALAGLSEDPARDLHLDEAPGAPTR